MSDLTEPERKLRVRALANEYLLRTALARLMLLDPGFAHDARQRLDTILGHYSVSEHANGLSLAALSAVREEYLHLLAIAEMLAKVPITPEAATASPKPKSIRRRIFEWLERG